MSENAYNEEKIQLYSTKQKPTQTTGNMSKPFVVRVFEGCGIIRRSLISKPVYIKLHDTWQGVVALYRKLSCIFRKCLVTVCNEHGVPRMGLVNTHHKYII